MSPQILIVIGMSILAFFIGMRITNESKSKRTVKREIAALTQFAENARQKIFPWPEGTSAEDQVRGLEDLKAGRPVVWYQHRTEEV